MIIIDTPEGMDHFQMARTIAALTIEVRTGMSHSQGSILKMAQSRYGCVKRTKKGALVEMRALYASAYGREYGSTADFQPSS